MKGNEMEWLTNWNENYSLAILFFGLAICFWRDCLSVYELQKAFRGDKKQGKT